MFSKLQVINKNTSSLLNSLFQYETDLERGNYDTLNAYASNWTIEEVIAVMGTNLSTTFSGEELFGFLGKLKKESLIPFASITQFFSLLCWADRKKQQNIENELIYLQNSKTMLYIYAGIPALCLVYINALEESSSLNLKSKLSAISQILISLAKNKQYFGAFGDIVVQTSVQRWLNLFTQLNPELRANFIRSKEKHEGRARDCLTVEKAYEKLTVIELYTVKILEKLDNNLKITVVSGQKELRSKSCSIL